MANFPDNPGIALLSQTHNEILSQKHRLLKQHRQKKDRAVGRVDRIHQQTTDRINRTLSKIDKALTLCKNDRHRTPINNKHIEQHRAQSVPLELVSNEINEFSPPIMTRNAIRKGLSLRISTLKQQRATKREAQRTVETLMSPKHRPIPIQLNHCKMHRQLSMDDVVLTPQNKWQITSRPYKMDKLDIESMLQQGRDRKEALTTSRIRRLHPVISPERIASTERGGLLNVDRRVHFLQDLDSSLLQRSKLKKSKRMKMNFVNHRNSAADYVPKISPNEPTVNGNGDIDLQQRMEIEYMNMILSRSRTS